MRRRSLRFATEQAALNRWLDLINDTARSDYGLAVEVARARTLVKGYGDTHARGQAKFGKLMALIPHLRGQAGSAAQMAGLLQAALADEDGKALDSAIAVLDRRSDRGTALPHSTA